MRTRLHSSASTWLGGPPEPRLRRVYTLRGGPTTGGRAGRQETVSHATSGGRRLSTIHHYAKQDRKQVVKGFFVFTQRTGKRFRRTARPVLAAPSTLLPAASPPSSSASRTRNRQRPWAPERRGRMTRTHRGARLSQLGPAVTPPGWLLRGCETAEGTWPQHGNRDAPLCPAKAHARERRGGSGQ